jgi:hypothetical protein
MNLWRCIGPLTLSKNDQQEVTESGHLRDERSAKSHLEQRGLLRNPSWGAMDLRRQLQFMGR